MEAYGDEAAAHKQIQEGANYETLRSLVQLAGLNSGHFTITNYFQDWTRYTVC